MVSALVVTSVRDYYDANTRRFLFFGEQEAIHREVWAPSVENLEAAMHYVHTRLATTFRGSTRLLDLGCGVGTSCFWLHRVSGAQTLGVSISDVQIQRAESAAAAKRVGSDCRFLACDYTRLPESLGDFDGAFAIEAFVHTPSTDGFFQSVSARLRPGARLVIVDDFMADESAYERFKAFRDGWHADALTTVRAMSEVAGRFGLSLIEDDNLSAYLSLSRPRDKLIRACVPWMRPFARFSPWFQSLIGGDDLQRGLQEGGLEYRYLVFEKA